MFKIKYCVGSYTAINSDSARPRSELANNYQNRPLVAVILGRSNLFFLGLLKAPRAGDTCIIKSFIASINLSSLHYIYILVDNRLITF